MHYFEQHIAACGMHYMQLKRELNIKYKQGAYVASGHCPISRYINSREKQSDENGSFINV